jgi:predicted site-specific integrase-resolvase
MAKYSTRQAAKKLGIGMTTLTRYIETGKISAPKATVIGRYEVRAWSDEDIERVRALLPRIANGRKTRYSKLKKQAPKTKRPKR